MRQRLQSLLLCILTYCVLLNPSAALASALSGVPPAEITGSLQPDLIPDNEALLMFFLSMSDGHASLPLDARMGLLRQSGFTEAEARAAIASANRVRSQYNSIVGQMRQAMIGKTGTALSEPTRKELDNLVARGWASLDAAEKALSAELGGPGSAKLKRFVSERVKPTMIYIPGK